MPRLQLDRRNRESTLLAIIGLSAVISLRSPIELGPMLIAELSGIAFCFVGLVLAQGHNRRLMLALATTLVLLPVVASFVARRFGLGVSPDPMP